MFVAALRALDRGGIKAVTFSFARLFAIVSAVRGRGEVEVLVGACQAGTYYAPSRSRCCRIGLRHRIRLTLTEQPRFPVPAFRGLLRVRDGWYDHRITPDLTSTGRVILALTMFAGRLGPLTLVLAVAARERQHAYRWPEEGAGSVDARLNRGRYRMATPRQIVVLGLGRFGQTVARADANRS
jgi:trk system potassium uptake protein TrkH